jgi:hypothetical protein
MDRNLSITSLASQAQALAQAPDRPSTASDGFAQSLQSVQSQHSARASDSVDNTQVVVQQGDTLTGLVKAQYRAQGKEVSEAQAYRQALRVAQTNHIANPNLIFPGQAIQLNVAGPAATSTVDTAPVATQRAVAITPSQTTPTTQHPAGHALLNQTLSRAVDKGYISAQQAPRAAQKVLALAEKYKFQPDDFARLTLMESGGMDPKASNGHCHGIIQFCDGPSRGAASVGMGHNPRAILGMGLLQQLDLVDAYFDHVGLSDGRQPVSLDELYLSVLTPAARAERRRHVPLAIPGRQAKDLHVGGNRLAPITRDSIVQGLHARAQQLFNVSPQAKRPLQQYAAVNDSVSASGS